MGATSIFFSSLRDNAEWKKTMEVFKFPVANLNGKKSERKMYSSLCFSLAKVESEEDSPTIIENFSKESWVDKTMSTLGYIWDGTIYGAQRGTEYAKAGVKAAVDYGKAGAEYTMNSIKVKGTSRSVVEHTVDYASDKFYAELEKIKKWYREKVALLKWRAMQVVGIGLGVVLMYKAPRLVLESRRYRRMMKMQQAILLTNKKLLETNLELLEAVKKRN